MSRWAPDAAGRLQQVALDLYAERGFEQTTVAEIAEAAGLTERTFFRHFADKREVLFRGADGLSQHLVDVTRHAPADLTALDAVVIALESLTFFDDAREWSSRRYAVIESSPDLRERELIKRATLAEAISGALRDRGESAAVATLAAEAGVTAFHVAYQRWVTDPAERTYAMHVREVIAELRATCSPTAPTAAV